MTRKKYNNDIEGENGNDAEVNSELYDSDYDSEKEFLEAQREEIENYERECFEEKESLRWWTELTNYPELYHLKNLSYGWFEELLETNIRPVQYQILFNKKELEPVPPHIRAYGITQEIWQLIC